MNYRQATLLLTSLALATLAGAVAPSVEIASRVGPHGTAPQQWLQRLDAAGAGTTRLVSSGSAEPRIESLGESAAGESLLKVYAVLARDNTLLLPTAEGARPFRLHDAEGLADYFRGLAETGDPATAEPRGKFGLTEEEFTALFDRLQKPMPPFAEGATLRGAIDAVVSAAGGAIEVDRDPAVEAALGSRLEGAASLEGLSVGTALAIALRQEGLALVADAGALRVVSAHGAADTWPVGYKPERSPSQTVPGLFEFLTVEVEGYTVAEALEAIGARVQWRGEPVPIVWDRFAMRRDGVDPTTAQARFPRRKTFYKNLLDKLATQGRLRLDLLVDEAGRPFLWLTR